MSDHAGDSEANPLHPLVTSGPPRNVHEATRSAELFSAALQQFATTTSGRRHVECDSDGFDDSDDDEEDEEEEYHGRVAAARRRHSGGGDGGGAGGGSGADSDDSAASSSSSSSSSDSAWGTFRGGEPQLEMCDLTDEAAARAPDECTDDGLLFVPEPIFDLSSLQHKPPMPCLPQDCIPIGASVWVVDEDDVATQLNCYFSAAYPPVCNGRLTGVVVRHSGQMTLVRFDNQAADLHFALCLPTSCLSLEPVEPYESSPRHGESYGLGSGAYGMLGPRAAGRGQAAPAGQTVVVARYLYEAIPAYDAEKLRGTALERAQELFFQGSFTESLAAVNAHLTQRQATTTAQGCSSPAAAAEAVPPPLADVYVLRSRVHIFLERYADALDDARMSVSLEPQWVRGYLSVARAHCGLGQFGDAAAAISQAYIMLPYSSELERIKKLNGYMHSMQAHLRAEGSRCYLILDGFYRKRLRVSAATPAGLSLCVETTPIVATHSVFAAREPLHRCTVCFRVLDSAACSGVSASPPCSEQARLTPTSTVSPALSSPVGTEPEEGVLYCSLECSQRASLYRPLEVKHRHALDHVRSLILSKGAVTLNVLPLEMASLTVRLFLMVVTTHRRLSAKRRLGESNRRSADSTGSRGGPDKETAQRDAEPQPAGSTALHSSHNPSPSPPVYIETALQCLGVYPLCTEPIKSNKLDELKIVYDVLTADFKAEDRNVFSCELLSQLYSYVSAYFTPVDLNALLPADATGRAPPHHTVYYLPNYVGCIEVAKTISYTASNRRQGGGGSGEDVLLAGVLGRPALEEAASAPQAGAGSLALGASNNEANCTVLPGQRPALLELVTVAPVKVERKLRCVPVSMALSSDVA